MYLSKNASGTYYTRLPLPKSLRDRGLPFAIRTSLCTKDRQLAVDRNLAVAARTRALIAATPADTSPRSFYRWIRADLDAFNAAGFIPPQTSSTPSKPSAASGGSGPPPERPGGLPILPSAGCGGSLAPCHGRRGQCSLTEIDQWRERLRSLARSQRWS